MDFLLEILPLILRILLFVSSMIGVVFLLYVAHCVFPNYTEMILNVDRFRDNHPDEYE